jgi:hypothetical protein
VQPLVWRNDLAADAQAWADRGTGEHSDVSKKERPPDQGESLYEKWGNTALPARGSIARDAAAWWASEKQFYDADPNKKIDRAHAVCYPTPRDTWTNWCKWGHYTQMVWHSTQEVGCGIKQGVPSAPEPALGWYVVCRYRPAGTTDGQEAYPPTGSAWNSYQLADPGGSPTPARFKAPTGMRAPRRGGTATRWQIPGPPHRTVASKWCPGFLTAWSCGGSPATAQFRVPTGISVEPVSSPLL